MYIVDDCDHAGVWQVDFEVARIRTGQDVNYETAQRLFAEKIFIIEKFKWFIIDFVPFQYGELSEKNRLHVSVLSVLSKYELGAYKPLIRGQGQGQGQSNGQGTRQGQEQGMLDKLSIAKEILNDERFISDLQITHKGKDIKQAFDACWNHFSVLPHPPEHAWQWKQKLNTWLTNTKNGQTSKNGSHKLTVEGTIKRRNSYDNEL